MNFTGFYLVFLTAAFAYEYLAEVSIKKKERPSGVITAKWSYKLMAGSYILLLIGTVAEYFLVKREINLAVSIAGLAMYISGHLMRSWAVKSLAEYWSLHIEVKEGHKLIKNGPYKYMRHPNYLATILKGLGFVLVPNAYYLLAYFLIVFFPVRLVRIHLEEKELIREFGPEYLEYQKEVYALLPLKKIQGNYSGR